MNKEKTDNFESLFRLLQPRLFAFCCKYVEDKEIARDFVQECFVNLWENYDTIQFSHKSYLFMAVRNRCLSYFRSLKVHATYEESVKLRIKEIEFHPEMSEPLTEMYLHDIQTILKQSIDTLPPKCKLIFTMSRYEEQTNAEIAEALGLSIRTVEAQIYSALKLIKAKLKDYLPPTLFFFLLFV